MADKSILSIRGEVNWAAGDYSNVINSTRRMMQGLNSATTAEIRAGQKASSAAVQIGLDSIEKQEAKAAKKLVTSKAAISKELAAVEVRRSTPPKVTSRSGEAVKQKAKEVNDLVKAGENAHKRLQKLQEAGGMKVAAGAKYQPEEFGKLTQAQREAEMGTQRGAQDKLRDDITLKKEQIALAVKRKTKVSHLRKELEMLELTESESVRTLK